MQSKTKQGNKTKTKHKKQDKEIQILYEVIYLGYSSLVQHAVIQKLHLLIS